MANFSKARSFTEFLAVFNNLSVPVGNFGIPRSSMPQIDVDLIPSFMEFLEDNEVDVEFDRVPANMLSLTQSEFNKGKVLKLMRAIRRDDEKVKRIFISSDGYVVDGSHRFIAALNIHRRTPVSVTRINMPIMDILKLTKRFHKARYRNVSDAKLK